MSKDVTPKSASKRKSSRAAAALSQSPTVTPEEASTGKRNRWSYAEPDCIYDDDALRDSWEHMLESGGWR